jgi:tRNA dimethylallyltransferase
LDAGDPPLLILVGPTGVGKSALALRWAEAVGAEIIAADSTTVYRGADIGTAKPTSADRARVRHHLLDVADPDEQYSVGRFVQDAQRAAREIWQRGNLPLVVGGTGLFVRALARGYQPPPPAPAARRRLAAWWAREGLEPIRRQLRLVDPASYAAIAPGDARRMLRALEVLRATGRPLPRAVEATESPGLWVGLTRDRAALRRRIAQRAHEQLQAGLQREVLDLHRRGVAWTAPAMLGLGYRECGAWARGRLREEDLLALMVLHTSQYAKRQMTWFRRDPEIRWINLDEVGEEGALRQVVAWTAPLRVGTQSGGVSG